MKHFSKALMRSALALLMIFTTTVSVLADGLSGTGTQNDPFIIASAQDWQTFADSVNNGNGYSDQFIKLTSDLYDVTTMVGDTCHPFQGVFLGDGHTINLNLTATENYIAPFRYLQSARIYSLHTTGIIDANTYTYAAGIAAMADTLLMAGCRSSVTIKGSIDGDGYYGGLIAICVYATLYNCLFDGSIEAPYADCCGGVIGYSSDNNTHMKYCLVTGTMSCVEDYSGTFGGGPAITEDESCYFKTQTGYSDGTQTDATDLELLSLFDSGWQIKDDEVVPITDVKDVGMCILLQNPKEYQYTGEPIEPCFTYTHLYLDPSEIDKNITFTISDSQGNTVSQMTDRGRYTFTFTGNEQEGLHGSFSYPVYVTGLLTDSVGNNLIENDQDWEEFARLVNESGYDYEEEHIKLTNDITIKSAVGTRANPFMGFFDGCGHTINMEIPDNDTIIAPFNYITNAYISRLNVTGTYNNPRAYIIAGMVGSVTDKLILNSCRSSINIINSSVQPNNALYSGFVLESKGYVEFINCLFDGNIQAPGLRRCSGFISSSNDGVTFYNCMMAGAMECDTLSSGVFTISPDNAQFIDCYHNTDFSLAQGTQTSATGNELKALLGEGWVVSNEFVIPDIDDKNLKTSIGITDYRKYQHYTGSPTELRYTILTSSFDYISTDTCCSVVITDSQDQITDAVEPGEYTATFTGIGQYSGRFSVDFTVKVFPLCLEIDEDYTEGEEGYFYINIKDSCELTLTNDDIKHFKVYDSGGKDSNYENDIESYFVMHAPQGYIFKLTGTFNTEKSESNDGEYFDYVLIHDGSTSESSVLAGPLFSATDSTTVDLGTLYSSGPDMMIYFYSDFSINNEGLDFTVSLVKESDLPSYDIIVENCPNGKIQADVMNASMNKIITLTAVPDPGYYLDSISVVNMNGDSLYLTGGTWYNNVATFKMSDTAVVVKAHFTSVADLELYVNMPYKRRVEVTDTIKLTDLSIQSFKVYDSEGKDRNYLSYTKSNLVMFAPQGYIFKLTGSMLIEEGDTTEYYDYVNVYDGSTKDSTLLLAGPLLSPDESDPFDIGIIYSSGPVMMISFITDESDVEQGLDFTVTLVPADEPTLVNSPGATNDEQNWYLPDGRLLIGSPAEGKLYINGDRKVIIIP
jgi:hypothetical protein